MSIYNMDRITRAETALKSYINYYSEPPNESDIQDLITDLLHLAYYQHNNLKTVQVLLQAAHEMFEEEKDL